MPRSRPLLTRVALTSRTAAPLALLPLLALGACIEAQEATPDELAEWRDGPGDVFPPPYAEPGHWTLDEPVCGVPFDPAGGGGIPQQLGIDPPIPPQQYDVPRCLPAQELANECRNVSNAGELQAAALFDPGHPMDIILDDGYYLASGLDDVVVDPASYMSLGRAHRLWAKNSGKAILTFGVVAGGNYCNPALAAKFDGSEFHGLVFDITNSNYAYSPYVGGPTSALANWGHSRGMKVQDCWFRGWETVERAISVSRPDGLLVERVEMLSFKRFGISVELGWPAAGGCAGPAPDVAADPAQLRDLAVHGIADPAWSSQGMHPNCGNNPAPPAGAYCPGTQEHGIWIGEPTTLERARVRDVAWTGIVVAEPSGPLTGVTLRDIDIDRQGSNEDGWGGGIGFERGNDGTLLEQFCIGPDVRRGVHSEWDHSGTMLSNIGMTIADGWSRASYVGISLDGGTQDVEIDNVRIDEACLTPMLMESNSDILPYTDCCTTTSWTTFDITGSTSPCDVLISHMPSVSEALAAPTCSALLTNPTLTSPSIDFANDCRSLALANVACANNAGMDACP